VTGLSVLYVAGVVATVGALLLLDRQRRRFLAASRQQRVQPEEHFLPSPATAPPASDATEPPIGSGAASELTPPVSLPADTNEAMVYIDATGRCTFPNEAARDLFHWKSGELVLSDILAGGREEFHELLDILKREGVVAQHVTALADPSGTPLEISGLALRDQNGNAWRAALFIHRRTTPHLLRGALP
jgi:PAS domain-containing protein